MQRARLHRDDHEPRVQVDEWSDAHGVEGVEHGVRVTYFVTSAAEMTVVEGECFRIAYAR